LSFDISILEKIFSHAICDPFQIAISQKEETKSYAVLSTDIKLTASKLISKGVDKQQCVMVSASNDYCFICCYFAIHLIGAKVIIFAPDIDIQHKNSIRKTTKPSLLIDNCSSFSRNIADYDEYASNQICNHSISDIMFTSGTTGKAKGVPLTHNQILGSTKHIIKAVKNTNADTELLLMPLSHSFGMGRMRTTLFAGGTLILGYRLQRLKSIFKAMELHNVTGLGLVPSAWKFITNISGNFITKYATQLKYIELGSAHLTLEEKSELTLWFPDTHLVMHYGLTEVSRALYTNLHIDDHRATGLICNDSEVKIINENQEFLNDNETGEILLKAPWMLDEYYNNHKLNEKNFLNGYIKTGDQGYLNGNYLFLTGRILEMINVGGKKVSPYYIEQIINNFDFVKESACVGLPDKVSGELVHAFIVLNPNINIEEKAATDQLEKNISSMLQVYMRPSSYNYLGSLPKTPTGKIQRMKLIKS
tara:strand:- start:4794 stop:6227 length:1434 start_codon:yes stop_codon:yes gene_type:complete